ncbi:hypothetical protein [Roseateles sp.]|uniref:hypothetical protein n=1 Tax=Roseateles sp. TaxID=1971397 RepID=UPI0037C8C312
MWKIALGFLVFAALALYILSTGGEIDMGGEKHGVDSHSEPAASAAAASAPAAPASAAVPAASAASQ